MEKKKHLEEPSHNVVTSLAFRCSSEGCRLELRHSNRLSSTPHSPASRQEEAEPEEAAGSRWRRWRRRRVVRCLEGRRRSAASWSLDASAPSGTSPDGKHSPPPDEEEEGEEEGR